MRLEPVDLLLDGLQIVGDAAQIAADLGLAAAFLEIAQLLALVVEELLELPLDEGGLALPLAAAPAVRLGLDLVHLGLEVGQLLLQPHLLPLGVRLGRAEVGARRLEAGAPEPRQVLVAELGLAARRRGLVGLGGPPRGGGRVPLAVDLVVDLAPLERRAQRRRDRPRDPEPLVSVVEDVEEGEARVFVDRGRGGWVDQVPRRPDVGVGHIERFVEVFEGIDCGVRELAEVTFA